MPDQSDRGMLDEPSEALRLRQPIQSRQPECPLASLRDKLRRVGLRPTRQRVSLGWLLFGNGDRHITAEMLYEEAIYARIRVSLATVYNTLHQFTEAGLLRQLAVEGAKAYFDTNPTEHHHYFIEGEEVLVDVPAEAVSLGQLPEPPEGMEIASVEVIVRLRAKKAHGQDAARPIQAGLPRFQQATSIPLLVLSAAADDRGLRSSKADLS